jgi:hypothetical protein
MSMRVRFPFCRRSPMRHGRARSADILGGLGCLRGPRSPKVPGASSELDSEQFPAVCHQPLGAVHSDRVVRRS